MMIDIENEIKNNAIASNNTIQNQILDSEKLLDTVLEALLMPVEKYKQLKLNIIAKQAHNFERIVSIADRLRKEYDIQIKQPPLKFSIPFMEKSSSEHEKDMYEQWAKLLVASATNYNPIHIQYAEILSKIGSEEALLLKDIYLTQKETHKKDLPQIIDSITGTYGILYKVYKNNIESNKYNVIDFLYCIETNVENSFDLLIQLGLIKKHINQRLSSDKKEGEPYQGFYLTEFGYNFVDCLEGVETQCN